MALNPAINRIGNRKAIHRVKELAGIPHYTQKENHLPDKEVIIILNIHQKKGW